MADENDLKKIAESLTAEQTTQLRKLLKSKGKYVRKGAYREKENKVRILNPDEWETFIYSTKENIRKYYWFLFLTGVRYKEAKHIQKQHIDFKNRTIILFKPKGGVQRYVSFSTFGKQKLKQFFEGLQLEDTLEFPSIQHLIQTMKKICKENNMPYWEDISVHNIRKSHENNLIALNLNQAKITAHLGHNLKTATEHYISSNFIKDKNQLDKSKLWFGDIFG